MTSDARSTRDAVSLTQRALEALRPAEKPFRVPDHRCIGLAVRVAPSGCKTWDLAYRIRGSSKIRRVSLGRVSDVPLEKARDRANELTGAARAGRDLIGEEADARATAASRMTVEALIDLYVRRRVAGRLRTASDIERRLRRTLKPILHWYAEDVKRRNLRALFDEAADQGIEREAEKRRQTVGAMFRWALSQDAVEMNPCAGLSAYDPGTPRDRVLTTDEIATLWNWLERPDLPPNLADILKVQLATGARCGEVSGIHAEEINTSQWIWVLPAARSKNKRLRVTPMVGITKEILEKRLRDTRSGPLFTAQSGAVLSSAHVGHYLLARKLPIEKFITHDLRRTVATTLTEIGIPLELVAAVIGHEAGGRETRTLVRHYVRTDLVHRKRHVLEAWHVHLMEIVGGQKLAHSCGANTAVSGWSSLKTDSR